MADQPHQQRQNLFQNQQFQQQQQQQQPMMNQGQQHQPLFQAQQQQQQQQQQPQQQSLFKQQIKQQQQEYFQNQQQQQPQFQFQKNNDSSVAFGGRATSANVGGGGVDSNTNAANAGNDIKTTTASSAVVAKTPTAMSGKAISSMHSDYVHHVEFDVYGRRMATCSGDRFVRVWDLTDNGDWELVGEFQAHRGSVSMLAWAHPEFGPLLATCGSDHDAKIWEEGRISTTPAMQTATFVGGSGTTTNNNSNVNNASFNNMATVGGSFGTGTASKWTTKAQLTEARKAVSCLEFAPRHWGLKLATGSADGCVRIYEAVDIMNLSQWPLSATIQCFSSSGSGGSSSRQSYGDTSTTDHGLGVLCLSWCTGRFEPPTLVVGGSHCNIYRYSESTRSWQLLLELSSSISNVNTMPHHNVLDVSWAPNVGRRFHYIAAAEDHQLRIFKLLRPGSSRAGNVDNASITGASTAAGSSTSGATSDDSAKAKNSNKLQLESYQTLQANAWRCQWNVTGTVLASSGDGGIVQLWKSDFDGNFQCVSQTMGYLSQMSTPHG